MQVKVNGAWKKATTSNMPIAAKVNGTWKPVSNAAYVLIKVNGTWKQSNPWK